MSLQEHYLPFESSVNSYDSQTYLHRLISSILFESSVNSYDSQTIEYKWITLP